MIIKILRVILSSFKHLGYDLLRYIKHLNYAKPYSTIDKYLGQFSMHYHSLEKGLVMPELRLGFGSEVVKSLLRIIENYELSNFPKDELEFIYSISVLKEYKKFHDKKNFVLDKNLQIKLNNLFDRYKEITESKQIKTTNEKYFEGSFIDFEKFAFSRYSVRNYIKKQISNEIIVKCTEIALKSPSSCNRQSVRVYVFQEETIKSKILALQNGNRGFGHLSDTVFLITTNISNYQNFVERHDLALNAGMFAMSFLFALHSHQISTCALNWSVTPKVDKELRRLINLPENEQIHLLISSGYPPENFAITSSPRLKTNKILRFFKNEKQ